ncbi:MAG TPA: ferritin family protein [Rhodospirillales bacterium]|nr:ferritin family protein [Rhodospirillales bacterium]
MSVPGIPDLAHFLAHAHAMEVEAAERYRLFAGQMEVHNSPEVADLFAKLADIEAKHADEILARAGDDGLPHIASWDFAWNTPEGPETAAFEDAHYLMTPHHLLAAALEGERQAYQFYERIARETDDAEIRRLAEEYVDEEREHVALVEALLERHPEPERDWSEDIDPPRALE